VGISTEYVSLAKTALEQHSQNDVIYDPNKVTGVKEKQLASCDDIFDWAELPFNTKTSMEEFKSMFYES